MNEFEQTVAAALQAQFGNDWFTHGAHPQALLDYVTADNDTRRERIRTNMKQAAVLYAVGIIQAARHAGMVKFTEA